jgi:hypothetical protein
LQHHEPPALSCERPDLGLRPSGGPLRPPSEIEAKIAFPLSQFVTDIEEALQRENLDD